jgi:hypothetical protein
MIHLIFHENYLEKQKKKLFLIVNINDQVIVCAYSDEKIILRNLDH